MVLPYLVGMGDNILSGLIGGVVGAGLKEAMDYIWGWRMAGNNRSADFHIAATMYPEINLNDPAHKDYWAGLDQGKTHAQELIWLSGEVSLQTLLTNRYLYRQVTAAMNYAKDAGILLGAMPERAERPLLKKVSGFHSNIPNNGIVQLYKRHVGVPDGGRVLGISPPTHEHYEGSPHRRTLRAMFIADSQIEAGLPPKDKVFFRKETHGTRYKTLKTIIEDYKGDPGKYKNVRVFF